MLLPNRVAGRTQDLRGPDLARGPEVARRCNRPTLYTTTSPPAILILNTMSCIVMYAIVIEPKMNAS